MYCTHTNDEFIEYAALTIQAHTNDQPNCRRYAVSDRSILLEVETDLTGAHFRREPASAPRATRRALAATVGRLTTERACTAPS